VTEAGGFNWNLGNLNIPNWFVVPTRNNAGGHDGRGIPLSAAQLDNLAVLSNQSHLGHSDEQAMLDYSGNGPQLLGECRGIWDFAKTAVEDVMSFVGDVSVAIGISAQGNLSAQTLNLGLNH
jgi:hypothetical protein